MKFLKYAEELVLTAQAEHGEPLKLICGYVAYTELRREIMEDLPPHRLWRPRNEFQYHATIAGCEIVKDKSQNPTFMAVKYRPFTEPQLWPKNGIV